MNKRYILSLLGMMVLCLSMSSNAQTKFLRTGLTIRTEQSVGYLMLLGDDNEMFRTSVKGFGSGLWDMFNYRQSMDLIHLGTEKIYLSLGGGYSINKYRFSNNILLKLDNNGIVYAALDTIATHDYVNTFFGYGKTKLVYGSVYVPLALNIVSDNLVLSIGGLYDFWVSGKFKSKYKENGAKTVDKIPNRDLSKYPFNKQKLGLTVSVIDRKSKFGIAVTYMNTPLFEAGNGPALNEFRIGLFRYSRPESFSPDND